MDIVLEVLDFLMFDRFYAAVRPISGFKAYGGVGNGTSSSVGATPTFAHNNYQYHPASKYLSIEPGKWAYMSSWQRDDPLRQFVTLYLITW
jgi:lathosterol oxidase